MSDGYANQLAGEFSGGDLAAFRSGTGFRGSYADFGFDPAPAMFAPAAGPSVAPSQPGGLYAAPVRFDNGNAYAGIDASTYLSDKKKGASNLNAAITRAQYDDYERRFMPIEDMAVGLLKGRNTADLPFDLARTQQSIAGAAENFQGQQERSQSRYGLKSKMGVTNTVDLAGAMVGGLNQTKLADEDRRMGLLAGVGGSKGGG
jgi:hypothetical protein